MGRLLLMMAAIAQLFGVVAGPLDHWRSTSTMGAHVEATGSTAGHYSHDEASCAACALLHVVALLSRRAAPMASWLDTPMISQAELVGAPPQRWRRTTAAPRAPPADALPA